VVNLASCNEAIDFSFWLTQRTDNRESSGILLVSISLVFSSVLHKGDPKYLVSSLTWHVLIILIQILSFFPFSNPLDGVECRMDFGFGDILIGEQISEQSTLCKSQYGSTSPEIDSLSFANNLSINKKTTVQDFPKLI
jgi:hypothetical protein